MLEPILVWRSGPWHSGLLFWSVVLVPDILVWRSGPWHWSSNLLLICQLFSHDIDLFFHYILIVFLVFRGRLWHLSVSQRAPSKPTPPLLSSQSTTTASLDCQYRRVSSRISYCLHQILTVPLKKSPQKSLPITIGNLFNFHFHTRPHSYPPFPDFLSWRGCY